MYSLSVLAKLKQWKFIYYVDHIPSFLKSNPSGNYKYALENGMEIVEQNNLDFSGFTTKENELFISEGGAIKEAQWGIEILAKEIKEYQQKHSISNLKVFLPSGTGTTALFLQKFLTCEVFTVPCVADSTYLKKQFLALEPNDKLHPTIIDPARKYHFGKLYKENYLLWKELKEQTKIEFDLLYDPIGWNTLLKNEAFDQNATILYIHQGGILGNETMIQRYHHKWQELYNT
jgi:1-aminocyclopropane-1-carboxylate deaminase/D-cysteine desulfhydrase-like pyridoxal-dependent ACC family enzyme